MHHDCASEHALRANELDELVLHAALRVALPVRLEVAKVTYVAVAVFWGAVFLAVGVDCATLVSTSSEAVLLAGGCVRTMRTSARAAVGIVTESMDVHATLGVGIVAGHIPADGRRGALGGLLEGNGALDVGVSTKNGNCRASTLASSTATALLR
jgi:hypothetical protein